MSETQKSNLLAQSVYISEIFSKKFLCGVKSESCSDCSTGNSSRLWCIVGQIKGLPKSHKKNIGANVFNGRLVKITSH